MRNRGLPVTPSLGDRLRRLLGKEEPSSAARDRAARPHHYAFAHIVLRDGFLNQPRAFAAALEEQREELLRAIWSDVGDTAERQGGDSARLSPRGLRLHDRRVGAAHLLIVELPAPERPPECYFTAMAVREGRYLTLESGYDPFGGKTRTVLCEWRGQTHCNAGDGPEATVDAFSRAVARYVGVEPETAQGGP